MANDYSSLTFMVAPSSLPDYPTSIDDLAAIYSATEAPGAGVFVISRKDQTFGELLQMCEMLKLVDLRFLEHKFDVLETSVLLRIRTSLDKLMDAANQTPETLLEPFAVTYVDGTRHQMCEPSQISKALELSTEIMSPDYISDEDCYFLVDVFCYVKSLRRLIERSLAEGAFLGFARINELCEGFRTSERRSYERSESAAERILE